MMSNVDQYKEVLERCFDDIAALKKAHAERIAELENGLKEAIEWLDDYTPNDVKNRLNKAAGYLKEQGE